MIFTLISVRQKTFWVFSCLFLLTGCGAGIEKIRQSLMQEELKNDGGGADAKASGSIAFDLTGIQGDIQQPDSPDKLDIKYSGHCDVIAHGFPVDPGEPDVLLGELPSVDCNKLSSGVVEIDLKKRKNARIRGLIPGDYLFEAVAYLEGVEMKRGKTILNIKAGKVARGSIVLRKSGNLQDTGGAVIGIVDENTASACALYQMLVTTPQTLRCQSGVFTCTYQSKKIGSQAEIPKLFRRRSNCSELEARRVILKELCAEDLEYKDPIQCTHSDT